MSLDDFPRYPLLFGPSPVHPLERLTAHLGGARIWAKREDCNSGVPDPGGRLGPSARRPRLRRLGAGGGGAGGRARSVLRHDRGVQRDRLLGRLEGMIIDPVYEGKSMAGLIDLVTTGEIGRDATVLYAHLGGQPALNAYSALFRG